MPTLYSNKNSQICKFRRPNFSENSKWKHEWKLAHKNFPVDRPKQNVLREMRFLPSIKFPYTSRAFLVSLFLVFFYADFTLYLPYIHMYVFTSFSKESSHISRTLLIHFFRVKVKTKNVKNRYFCWMIFDG